MSKKFDELSSRMKNYYEIRNKSYLPRNSNVMFRLDGRAFKTYTKGFMKPFDADLVEVMNKTAVALCEGIQGAVCAFVQSDEISVYVIDYQSNNADAWFDYEVQKIISNSASIATMNFNKMMWAKGVTKDAIFDSRVFTLPTVSEVENCFMWRQQDCTRNSISTVAQSLYSQKELHGKNTGDMQELIWQRGDKLVTMLEKNPSIDKASLKKPLYNWNDLPAGLKRGRFIVKEDIEVANTYKPDEAPSIRSKWVIKEAPMFNVANNTIQNLVDKMIAKKKKTESVIVED